MTGDEQRFTSLMESTGPRLLGYFARRTDPPADAADLLAELMVVTWRRFPEVPSGEQEALRWLFGVARRVLANHRRGRIRRSMAASRLRDRVALVTSDHAPATDEMLAVRQALAALKEEDREVLLLIAWEGLSPSEAAEVLDLDAATVRQRLHRARLRLRRHLTVDEGESAAWAALG